MSEQELIKVLKNLIESLENRMTPSEQEEWRNIRKKYQKQLNLQTRVVNLKTSFYDVYIGRGSLFGNPYTVKKHGREKCLELYRTYFLNRIQASASFRMSVLDLHGQTLGCYCNPQPCHGDIIKEYIEDFIATKQKKPYLKPPRNPPIPAVPLKDMFKKEKKKEK